MWWCNLSFCKRYKRKEPRSQDAKNQRIKTKENQESKNEYKKIQNGDDASPTIGATSTIGS